MNPQHGWFAESKWGERLLKWVNLRPDESERTFFMFAFYTTTSIGLLWLETSAVTLFLDKYQADGLPWIYVASAGMGSGLGFVYSQLQKMIPLRRVIVVIAVLMAAPLILFYFGLSASPYLFGITVFVMRLWLEAIYVLNDLNTSITANQLFNIREVKRAYPLISSGILLADVVSGFSLTIIVHWVGLSNVILLACGMMAIGAGILFYLSQSYQQAFPDSLKRRSEENQPDHTTRRLRGPIRRYVILLFGFFIMAQVLFLLVDFQFLSQLKEVNLKGEELASILGLFSGILGIFELSMQWLASSRVIERVGVFAAAMLLPVVLILLGAFSVSALLPILWGTVALKFLYELLHYTLFIGISPVLFQPVPDSMRSELQAVVRGIAEPISTGVTGLAFLGIIWVAQKSGLELWLSHIFILLIVILALVWFSVIWFLRARYVSLLVVSAERGQLSLSEVDLREVKRAVVEALDQPGTEAHKRSCIELLSQIDPRNVGEVLAPLLIKLPPALKRQSLEAMLAYPNPTYLPQVQALVDQPLPPEVLAVALRYVWLTQDDPDIRQLRPYLQSEVDPVVRGTAASLMMRRGNPTQKAEATNTLRLMLTHKRERERVMGCRALGEAVYLQALRLYIPQLLQDESLRVRCALLEAIAATHLEEYYPSLLRGLVYKSTRDAAMQALVRLENDAIPMLVELATDVHKPELVRTHAWKVIGQIGTMEALDALISQIKTAWGTTRRNILRILLKMPQETGIDGVLDRLGRSGVELLINQELMFIGQIYAALLDMAPQEVSGREADFLKNTLRDLQSDAIDRLFMLMKFLYPLSSIQAAAFNLQSGSRTTMARGLEILDNTLDIPSKRALLSVLDRRSDREKMQSLTDIVHYESMSPSDRLRFLLELRHFLSDWSLACCFHLARQARWSLTPDQTISCLRHPTGFVRESVLSYLQVASPRALIELLPMLKDDPDRLVAAQVRQMMQALGNRSSQQKRDAPNGTVGFSNSVGLEPI
ncbi:MAG: MFS transporter [Scytolyngbya sp. HA4215-MV1]|jgi:HEAT repeat protein|nr:MFS transporter [Scytolyngbya sp. HA4215-MV1]